MNAARLTRTGFFPGTRHSLLDAMRARDDDAWQLFFDLYSPVIYRLGLRRGLEPADAEEVVAEVLRGLVVAFRNGLEIDPAKGRFRAYLQTMARNASFHKQQQRGRTGGSAALEAANVAAPDPDWERIEREEQLRLCWEKLLESGQLRRRDLRAFEDYALKGEPAKSVAARYEMTVNRLYGVKHQVMRALGKVFGDLRQHMEDDA